MTEPLRKKSKVEIINIGSGSDTTDEEPTEERPTIPKLSPQSSPQHRDWKFAKIHPPPRVRHAVNVDYSAVTESVQSPFRIASVPRLPASSNIHAVSLSDLLNENLVETWQINFSIDLAFIISSINETARDHCILHFVTAGDSVRHQKAVIPSSERINLHNVVLPIEWGTHHTKMMFNYFHDGTCQVVIHTANLLRIDWEQKTEALWLSPVLKRVKQETQVSSDNNHFGARFKADILQYIRAYHNASLQSLIDELNKFDFSPVRAIFIGSVPGYYGLSDTHFGLQKLRRSLRNATFEAQISDSTIAQVSSLGNLGKSFYAEFQNALNTAPSPKTQAKTKTVSSHFRLIFPTRRNFQNSINGLISGLSLFFNRSTSSGTRQLELSMPHLHSWHASRALRDDVMPHVKTYARVNGDDIRWILVTSSNLSKAAWGGVERGKVKIKSYEAGVLLIPDLFMASSDQAVSIKGSYGRDDQHTGKGIVNISMCYNLDLKKYAASDWIWSTAEAAEILSR